MNWVKLAIALTVLGGLALAGTSEAFTYLGGKWHDPAMPVPYRLNTFQNEPTVPGNDEFTDVRLSFLNWENVANARIAFVEGAEVTTPTPCAFTADGQNVLSFRDCGAACTGNCIAATLPNFDLGADYALQQNAHFRIWDADIVFGSQWSWITLQAAQQQGCAGRMIIQSIATHEIGHLIGLGHSNVAGSTMFATTTFCDQNPASLAQDDINGCVDLYSETLRTYEIATHDVNQVRCGITNAGNVGLPSGAVVGGGVTGIGGGAGFQFPVGQNHLFEGSFIFAREAVGDTNVSDDYRVATATTGGPQDADFLPLKGIALFTPGAVADQESGTEFDDSAANRPGIPLSPTGVTTPLGIRVRQETYAWSAAADAKYVIHVYRLKNMTGASINNLNAGLIMDWDFTVNFSTNSVNYDAPNRLGYVSDPSTANRVGVRVLNSQGTRSFRALTSSGAGADVYNNTSKADWLKSGFTQTSLANRDIGMLICTGPYNIAPGATVVAAFAICAGTSLADLQAVSQAAQVKWDTVLQGITGIEQENNSGVVGPSYALKQNAPNPFNPATRIGFTMSRESMVSLKIFDLGGRLVRTLVEERKAGGDHDVMWDGRDDAGKAVASGTYFYELRADGQLVQSRKMQLMK